MEVEKLPFFPVSGAFLLCLRSSLSRHSHVMERSAWCETYGWGFKVIDDRMWPGITWCSVLTREPPGMKEARFSCAVFELWNVFCSNTIKKSGMHARQDTDTYAANFQVGSQCGKKHRQLPNSIFSLRFVFMKMLPGLIICRWVLWC